MKKGIIIFFLCAAFIGVSFGMSACTKKKDNPTTENPYNVFASGDASKAIFGVSDLQRVEFVKSGSKWDYNGMFASFSGGEKKVVEGKLIDSLLFSAPITSVEVVSSDVNGFEVQATAADYTVVFKGYKGVPFIERSFSLKLSDEVNPDDIIEGDVKFYLTTPAKEYKGERGFAGTYSEDDNSVYLYGANPSVYSQATSTDGTYSTAITMVMDWDATSPEFKKARRFYNHTKNAAQVGFYNSAKLNKGTVYNLVDHVMVSDGGKYDSYKQLSAVRNQLSKISPVDFDDMYEYDNRAVDDYSVMAKGLTEELLDGRSYSEGLNGAYAPYAFGNGWGESSTNLWISRGFTKYAASTQNTQLINEVTNRVVPLTSNGWIENAYGYGDYLHYSYSGGVFTDGDNSEISGNVKASGTWKYFDRVCAMGEIGLYTNNAQIKEAFFKLLPVVRNKMVGDDYFQPVCYRVDNAEPLAGLEGGGSAGGAALWGYINLLAYRLTDASDPLHNQYLVDAKGSINRASALSFNQAWSILNAPKPFTIGWIVRGNVELYELTGETVFLDQAKRAYSGLYHFTYALQDPYSPFYSAGYSVACAKERWAALFEMGAGLWMCAPILKYVDDPALLELYSAGYYGGLWYFPVNGEGTGNIHGAGSKDYEWPEAKYIPYEFATGGLNDPSIAGRNDQALYRETKETYGAGEALMLNMIFDGYGTSVNKKVNLVCTTGVDPVYNTNHIFRAFNSSTSQQNTVLRFKNLVSGVYEVKVNGTSVGKYSTDQLAGGLKFAFNSKESKKIELVKSEGAASGAFSSSVTLAVTNNHNTANIVASASGANHFMLEICSNNKFNAGNTTVMYSFDGKFGDRFADGAKRFYRVKAFDGSGNGSVYSSVSAISPVGVNVLAGDDFKLISGWSENNTKFNTTGSAGVMNILKNDTGEGVSSVSKIFNVDMSGACLFEFEPYAKTHGSLISVDLTIGNKVVRVADKLNTFDRNIYSANVKELFSVSGEAQIKVTVTAEGINRGFMMEGVRFVCPLTDSGDNYVNVMETEKTGALAADYSSGVYKLNSSEEVGLTKLVTTQKTNLNGKYLNVTLGGEGLTILKKMKIVILSEDERIKYFESSGSELVINTGLTLKMNLNQNSLIAFPNDSRKYSIKLQSVAGFESFYEKAFIADAEMTANADFSGLNSIVGASASDNSVKFNFKTDLSKNGILVFNCMNLTRAQGTAWKLYCYDVAADELVEMRIKDEIVGFESNADYKTKISNVQYFREKTGVFSYEIADIMGRGGERDYQIIIEIVGTGSMDIVRLELCNINNQLAVF